MLHLASETPDGWVVAAEQHIDALLLDHAHCEKKAASTAMNLIFRYGEHPLLVRALSAIAREELEHFELMLDVLDARGVPFVRLEPSPYAPKLLAAARSKEPGRMLDTLLCCALIEARSCERMKRLSEGLSDPDLRALYKSLLASEARHFHTYIELIGRVMPEADVKGRLAVLAAHEARVLDQPSDAVRMHSAFAT